MEIQYRIVYIGVNNSVVLYTNIDQNPWIHYMDCWPLR